MSSACLDGRAHVASLERKCHVRPCLPICLAGRLPACQPEAVHAAPTPAVQHGDDLYLVDAGEGTRHQVRSPGQCTHELSGPAGPSQPHAPKASAAVLLCDFCTAQLGPVAGCTCPVAGCTCPVAGCTCPVCGPVAGAIPLLTRACPLIVIVWHAGAAEPRPAGPRPCARHLCHAHTRRPLLWPGRHD